MGCFARFCFSRIMSAVLVVGLCLSAGCSGQPAKTTLTVSGKATFAGEPIKEGDILFIATDGAAATDAGKIADGSYVAEVSPGAKKVQIVARRPVPGKFDTSNPGQEVPILEQYIPPGFNEQTTLTADVSDAKTTFDFELAP